MSATQAHAALAGFADPLPRLWGRASALRTGLLSLLGVVVWFVGWYLVAGEGTTAAQIGPMNVAIVGVLVAGAGQLSWILEGRRSVGRMRRELLGDARRTAAPPAPQTELDARLVAGTRYYHRVTCTMVTAQDAAIADRTTHEAAGRLPCGVCAP